MKRTFSAAGSDVFLFHLKEAQDDLEAIISRLEEFRDGTLAEDERDLVCDEALPTFMAHLYHHLNTGWNARYVQSLIDPVFDEEGKYELLDMFPIDLSADMAHGRRQAVENTD